MPELKPDYKPGDVLTASTINAIVKELFPDGFGVRASGYLNARQGEGGQTQAAGTQLLAFIGKANGNIAAASGDTPASGSVTRWRYNGSTNVTTSTNYPVLNASTTTMTSGNGIDSGQRCWVQEDDSGWLWVTPLECD